MLYVDFVKMLEALHKNTLNALEQDLTKESRIRWEKLEGKLRSALATARMA